ncbi:hypothetical protein LWI29_006915 [Acer saccharum]|uniref:Uncharacterized protein n=1 Tax=Acer saccharum TaxID=4024 RepID=A0AA39W4X0_ACESA|nr:hypothetical protein LWI29_006915 [Acer saccharum]
MASPKTIESELIRDTTDTASTSTENNFLNSLHKFTLYLQKQTHALTDPALSSLPRTFSYGAFDRIGVINNKLGVS